MTLWPLFSMLALIFSGMPVAIALIAPSLLYFFIDGTLPLDLFAQKLVAATESFPLLALPFFVLAGSIMNAAGITRRLLALAEAFVGHLTGGLAQMSVILATMMGGLTASANADAAMLSKMLGPTMIEKGYPPGFAAAVVSTSAVIVAMIPPGIGLIVYAFMADVSVGALFVAGIVPGLLIAVTLMVIVYANARMRGFKPSRIERASMSEMLVLLKDASWALTIPVFIIVGLRYGLFTPTEAGAIAVTYSILIGVFAYRDLHLRDVNLIIRESVNTISIVMLIIIGASAFGYYMVWERVPAQMTAAITAVAEDPLLLLFVINMILLLVGMFLEGTAAIILLSPILVPIVTSLGVDPVQFGIVMVLNLTMGGVTPPVGTLSFTSSTVIGAPITATFKETLPFLAGLLLVLAAVTYLPPVTQFLPGLFGY